MALLSFFKSGSANFHNLFFFGQTIQLANHFVDFGFQCRGVGNRVLLFELKDLGDFFNV